MKIDSRKSQLFTCSSITSWTDWQTDKRTDRRKNDLNS